MFLSALPDTLCVTGLFSQQCEQHLHHHDDHKGAHYHHHHHFPQCFSAFNVCQIKLKSWEQKQCSLTDKGGGVCVCDSLVHP